MCYILCFSLAAVTVKCKVQPMPIVKGCSSMKHYVFSSETSFYRLALCSTFDAHGFGHSSDLVKDCGIKFYSSEINKCIRPKVCICPLACHQANINLFPVSPNSSPFGLVLVIITLLAKKGVAHRSSQGACGSPNFGKHPRAGHSQALPGDYFSLTVCRFK